MKQTHFEVQNGFFSGAKQLRAEFDRRFSNPREAAPERFVWDYWHVENQYTLTRTPAFRYFSEALYLRFHQHLMNWGRRTLGCHDISPPWLSYYVDGGRQELHADVPHGPWAFVYSLTPWRARKFRGGETLILKPETLRYWESFGPRRQAERGIEQGDLVDRVPAEFNRLVVFDPRFPHGVTPVEGVRDPREGRLVIHGWFMNPRPFFEGPRTQRRFYKEVEAFSSRVLPALRLPECSGVCALRLKVDILGRVRQTTLLRQNLRMTDGHAVPNRVLTKHLADAIGEFRFSRTSAPTTLTLPWLFD